MARACRFTTPYGSRQIWHDGKPFITIHRPTDSTGNGPSPSDVDDVAREIKKFLCGESRRRRSSFADAMAPAAPSASAPVAQKPVTPAMAGFFDKIFGKKKPKPHPMSKRIYMVRTKSGTYVPAGIASMQGARRRRRRRR